MSPSHICVHHILINPDTHYQGRIDSNTVNTHHFTRMHFWTPSCERCWICSFFISLEGEYWKILSLETRFFNPSPAEDWAPIQARWTFSWQFNAGEAAHRVTGCKTHGLQKCLEFPSNIEIFLGLCPREISWVSWSLAAGMDFPIPPSSWWSTNTINQTEWQSQCTKWG